MQSSSSPLDSHRALFFLPLSLLLLLILLLVALSFNSSPTSSSPPLRSFSAAADPISSSSAAAADPPAPSLAYLLSGSDSDAARLLRLLRAVYHPNNLYLLHLDLAAPQDQRDRLARAARADPAFSSARNVHVVGRADFANPRGSSALAATLHGAAVLLRLRHDWDWFVNLDAADYPLVTQDDLLHVFSFLPKDLNFVEHSSYIGWRESRRFRPIVVDPGLYLSSKVDVFYATQKRELPNAYKLFTGSPSVILSRKFIDYCILGPDNLARALLMYYANTPSSHMDYFQTVLCNSPQFNRTIVNHALHFLTWDMPSKKESRVLGVDDLKNITQSGMAFGRKFLGDDPVLNQIDEKLLNRRPDMITPGGWCLGKDSDPCAVWGNANLLRPGPRAAELAKVVAELLSEGNFNSNQCVWN